MTRILLQLPNDFVSEYIKIKYPNRIILVIYIHADNLLEMLKKLEKDFKLEKSIFIQEKYINLRAEVSLIEFTSEKEAIEYCNNIKEELAFCVLYRNGEPIHENT